MLLKLAGLSIPRIDGDGSEPFGADLVWRHHLIDRLASDAATEAPFVIVAGEAGGEGARTDFLFGHGGRVHCRFVVGADGGSVQSWAIPQVSDRDLLALFGEHILRTVLVRRGLVSFHAASLSDGEGAILILGDKGMGKSTLSSALQQRGWSSIADDLTRVEDSGGAWRACPGLRDTKLLGDSIAALGLRREALPRRWDDPTNAGGDKRLLAPVGEPPFGERALGLAALLILKPRRSDGGELLHRIASPLEGVRALLEHVTEDPLDPEAPPSPTAQRAIGALIRSLPVIEVALPDRLDALRTSAETIEAIVRRGAARRAA